MRNESTTQKFPTTAPIATVLGIPMGHIQLIAADRADTTVEILPSDAAKKRDVAAAQRIAVAYDAGVLRIEAAEPSNPLLGSSGSVEVTVQLPAGSRIEAKAGRAELRGVGRFGDVTVEAASGSIKLDETGEAGLTLQMGDIVIGRLGGSAQLSTQKGDIVVTDAAAGTLTLRTEQGDITVGTSQDATLDAGTKLGRVDNTLKNSGTAALTIHATTGHGDIVARNL